MQIVRGGPEHRDQIIRLGGRALGWDDDDLHRQLFAWKHDANPFGPSPCWLAVDDGQVVAFRVFLNWRFTAPDGTTHRAVRAVDTATDPDHQGKGLFRKLTTTAIEELRADGVSFVFNSPNDQSRPGYLKMGWSELGRPPVAMAPRLRSLPRIARSRVAAERWSDLDLVAPDAPAALADDDLAHGLLATAAGADRPAWRTDRSAEWLRWRFGLPQLRYQVLEAADRPAGGPREAAVFRTRRRGDAVEATISELFAATPATGRKLVRAVLRRTGADYALVAGSRRVDATPALAMPAFSPLMTWRPLALAPIPDLADVAFAVGDLELF